MTENAPSLTARQAAVAAMLADRMTIKEIAAELGISESGVNKHIAALKRRFAVNALSEVVAAWRTHCACDANDRLRNPACPIPHLANPPAGTASEASKAADGLVLGDSGSKADWPGLRPPRILPRWLEGRNPIWRRLAIVFVIMLGLIAAVILAAAAIRSVSEIVSGTEPDLALRDEASG